jgi:hypothetical protein
LQWLRNGKELLAITWFFRSFAKTNVSRQDKETCQLPNSICMNNAPI